MVPHPVSINSRVVTSITHMTKPAAMATAGPIKINAGNTVVMTTVRSMVKPIRAMIAHSAINTTALATTVAYTAPAGPCDGNHHSVNAILAAKPAPTAGATHPPRSATHK